MITVLIIILIAGAVVYLFLGGREGFQDRIAELARLSFFAALLAWLLK